MSNFNVSNQNNMFNSYNNNMNFLFGGMSSSLGDLSLIRSGVYKKLLKAYYQTESSEKSSDTTSTTKTKAYEAKDALKKEQIAESMSAVKTDAQKLKDAVSVLGKDDLYMSATNEKGEEVDPKEQVTAALKDFVNAYNSFVADGSQSGVTSIDRKTLSVQMASASNAKLLGQVGITVGEGGKMTFDESKLDYSSFSTLKSLFQGSGSYGSTVEHNASESYRVANSNTYNTSRGSSYSSSGTYSLLGLQNSSLDNYL